VTVLPFYGTRHPELFAIERAAMDRLGRVTAALDARLGDGRVLDIGAGDGFSARALSGSTRTVVALEPAAGMIDRSRALAWLRGNAAQLPFANASFASVYATWAYFFPSVHPIEAGVREACRVTVPGGTVAIVNNLGGDEFCALSPRDISEPASAFEALGFELEVIETCFEFETLDDARALLGFYFGEAAAEEARTQLGYRVGLFHKLVSG
jgi:ubiquinone/menaquinone biosynthesis C-methylase UbiE